jgi:GntR family transcriptional regulator
MKFNKTSYKPYYIQIKEILKARIHKGIYMDKIPSENILADEFSVTRLTIRNSIKELKQEGILYSIKGKGTYISKAKIEQSLLKFYSFGRNYKGKNRVISLTRENNREDIADKLDYRGDKIFQLQRLRFFNNEPLILESAYIPEFVCPGLLKYDFSQLSIYDRLEEEGIKISRAYEQIEPGVTNSYQSEVLNIPLNFPVFHTERITYDSNEQAIELRRSIIRGDKFKFSVELW